MKALPYLHEFVITAADEDVVAVIQVGDRIDVVCVTLDLQGHLRRAESFCSEHILIVHATSFAWHAGYNELPFTVAHCCADSWTVGGAGCET